MRTPDTELSQNLRQHLPELSARLEREGLRTESWHPGAADSPRLDFFNRDAGSGDFSQPGQPGGQQQREERRPAQPPRQEPGADPDSREPEDFARLLSSTA